MKCGIQDFSEKFKTFARTSIQCCIDTLEKIEAARKNHGKTSGKTYHINSFLQHSCTLNPQAGVWKKQKLILAQDTPYKMLRVVGWLTFCCSLREMALSYLAC